MEQGSASSLQARSDGPFNGSVRLSRGLWLNHCDLELQTVGLFSAYTGMNARADAHGSVLRVAGLQQAAWEHCLAAIP